MKRAQPNVAITLICLILGISTQLIQAETTEEGYYQWPSYSPTLAYDYFEEYGPLNKPTAILNDTSNVAGTYIDGWWCFRYGPDKHDLVTSDAWIPMVQRFNEDFDYITNVMRWPRDKRARNGYYSTIYLYGSGLSTDNEPNTATGGWQGTTTYNGEAWPMVLASYVPVAAFDPSMYDSYQAGAMIHEGIHCILSSMPGCTNSAWFQEGGNTWLQGTMEGLRSGDFSSIGWLSAGAMIAPFMPIECYSGWLQDDTFGGPSAEGVNMYEGSQQICTWRNLLGGTQYGECFPHAMEVILGRESVAWLWRYCSQSGRVLQDMAEVEGGLGDTQMRRLIHEYRARQAFCDFGPWSYAFMQLLNNNWNANIGAEWEPYWIDCDTWKSTCYAKTTKSGQDLIPETRTLPGWSGANQIPLKVSSTATSATVTFNPIGENMMCQLAYRDDSGAIHYGVPVESGACSIPLEDVDNNVVIAIISNTDYVYEGESTRTAKFDYTLTMGDGISGKANIYTKWYNYTQSRYTLTATAGEHGTISDVGEVSIKAGRSHTFTLTPDEGYVVDNVAIDGMDIDQVTEYTFANVRGDHTIDVNFAPPSNSIWTICGNAGSIEPAGNEQGEVLVTPGEDHTFTMVPNMGFDVADVVVDGTSIGAVDSHTFEDVNDDHILKVEFTASSDLIPSADYLTLSCVTDTLSVEDNSADWDTYLPSGSVLTAINSPVVIEANGVQWIENLHSDGDGYAYGPVTAGTRQKGVTITTVVQPVRNDIENTWNSIMDIFYDDLILGLNNYTGEVQVRLAGTFYATGVTIPNQQKTVLSLVIQKSGAFVLYANGIEVYSHSSTGSFSISPGSGSKRYITLGRSYADDSTTFNGYLGDTFFYKTALSDSKRTELEDFLMTKYEISQ